MPNFNCQAFDMTAQQYIHEQQVKYYGIFAIEPQGDNNDPEPPWTRSGSIYSSGK